MRWSAAIVTISPIGLRSEMDETSVQVVRELVEEELHGEIVDERTVPGELDDVMASLIEIAEYYQPDLVLTVGGIGLGAHDVTPEATMRVVEREVPGMAEAMRYHVMKKSPSAMLTRAVCGIRNNTLIVNLPDSPKAVHENLSVIIDQLPIALQALARNSDYSTS